MIKKERLDKVIANMGYGSRKDVKRFIKEGKVKVNNTTILESEFKVNPYEDEISFNGEEVI